jgi:hypothetical protein
MLFSVALVVALLRPIRLFLIIALSDHAECNDTERPSHSQLSSYFLRGDHLRN